MRLWLVVSLVGALSITGPCWADSSVYIRSKFGTQLVTSSTMHWTAGEDGSRPEGAVEGGFKDGRRTYVCRAWHTGIWVAGSLNESRCQAAFASQIEMYDRYEVLENVDRAARLSWMPWDQYQLIPGGSVEAGGTYVARYRSSDDVVYLGLLDLSGMLSRIRVFTESGMREYDNGEILVEIEPVRYEMDGIRFNKHRAHVSLELKLMDQGILMNRGDEAMKTESVLAYESEYRLYWGQGKAILKGLPTVIHLPNSTSLDVKWGIEDVKSGKKTVEAAAFLGPQTAVNISLECNRTVTTMPYKARLTAEYEDGERQTREVNGSRREVMLMDIQVVYGPPYYITNGTLVPTTTTTTTTTTSTTTSSTSTTMRSTTAETLRPPPQPKFYDPVSDEPDDKWPDDVPSRNGGGNGMQSDEGSSAGIQDASKSIYSEQENRNSASCLLDRWSSLVPSVILSLLTAARVVV